MPCETAGHSLKRPYHVPVFSHFHPQTSHGSFPSGHGSGPACQKSKSSKFIAQRAFNILRPILWQVANAKAAMHCGSVEQCLSWASCPQNGQDFSGSVLSPPHTFLLGPFIHSRKITQHDDQAFKIGMASLPKIFKVKPGILYNAKRLAGSRVSWHLLGRALLQAATLKWSNGLNLILNYIL